MVIDMEQVIAELINRRRRQILVHSAIYYNLNSNIITDETWSKWATELVTLQKTYPYIAEKCVYADAFRDFDGSTGFDLPLRDPWVMERAERLLRNHAK